MNNKGVTLIELLIVIVVIGIISAFAVPAVSQFLDGAKKQAVYQDAVAVRNAAAYYCSQPDVTCNNLDTIAYTDLRDYLESFDASLYDTTGTIVTYRSTNAGIWYNVVLVGTTSGQYDWNPNRNNNSSYDPTNADSDMVTTTP